MRTILYSPLCMLGDPEVVQYDKATGAWTLNEARVVAEFRAVANAGAQGMRIMPWAPRAWYGATPFDLNLQFQPYALTADKKKYDLAKFNAFYFPIVKRVIVLARKFGMRVWFCWMDNCQFAGGYKKWSPWVTNVQGITSCYDPKAVPFIKTWIQKCYDEFAGLDVRWAWGNEMDNAGMRAIAKNAIFPMIKKLALDPKKMTYGATMKQQKYYPPPKPTPIDWEKYRPVTAGTLDDLKRIAGDEFGDVVKLGIWKEIHSIGGKGYPAIPNRLDQALYWWARRINNGIRIWLSDDGVKDGDSKCDVDFDGARPSAERWAEMVKITMAFKNDFTYEHLPQSANLACQVKTLKAIYKAIYGTNPVAKYPC
jgi:hypothetical protein